MPQNIAKLMIEKMKIQQQLISVGDMFPSLWDDLDDPEASKQMNLLTHHEKVLKLEKLITGDSQSHRGGRGSNKSHDDYQVAVMYGMAVLRHGKSTVLEEIKALPLTIQLDLLLPIKPTFKESMRKYKDFFLGKRPSLYRG